MKKQTHICQEEDWHNAFGDEDHFFSIGMRVTFLDSKYVGGIKFLSFHESPKDNWYMEGGFKSLRELN